MKKLIAVFVLTLVAACATGPTAPENMIGVLTKSPEAQIKAAADTHSAASTLGTVLLKNGGITKAQATGFSKLLHASSDVLDDAGKTLIACRAATKSTQATNPDPCALGVRDLIKLAADSITRVHTTLAAK